MRKRVTSKNPIQNQLAFAFPEKSSLEPVNLSLQYAVLGAIKPSPTVSYSLASSAKNNPKDPKNCVPVMVQNLKTMFPDLQEPSHVQEPQTVQPTTPEVKVEMQANVPDIASKAEESETSTDIALKTTTENKQSFAQTLPDDVWEFLNSKTSGNNPYFD